MSKKGHPITGCTCSVIPSPHFPDCPCYEKPESEPASLLELPLSREALKLIILSVSGRTGQNLEDAEINKAVQDWLWKVKDLYSLH